MGLGENLVKAAGNSVVILKEKAPLILTGASIGLNLTSIILAAKVTPQAKDIFDQIMSSNMSDADKRRDILRYVVPLYGPSAVSFAGAIIAALASYTIQEKRLNKAYEALAGLSTAYIFTQDKLKKYKDEVIEKFGEHVDEEIEDKVLAEQAKEAVKDPEKRRAFIANAGPEVEMEDSITGQHFMSTKDDIFFYFADLWTRLEIEDQVAASDYLFEVGCKQCSKGDEVGWTCGSRPWPKFVKTAYNNDENGYYYVVMVDTDPGFKPIYNY